MCYLFWLAFITTLFSPLALLFRWTLVEGLRIRARPGFSFFRRFHRLPIGCRLALFLGLNVAGWYALFGWIECDPRSGFLFVTGFAAVHFLALLLLAGVRKIRAAAGRRRVEKEKRSLARSVI